MPDRLLKYQLAVAVLAIWEEDVHRFAPDEHLRWQTLLKSLPEDFGPGRLCAALTPLVAKNEKEQALFAAIFERAEREVAEKNKEDEPLPPPPAPTPFWKTWTLWAGVIAVLSLVARLVWVYYSSPGQNNADVNLPITFSVVAKTSATVCPDSTVLSNWTRKKTYFLGNGSDSLNTTLGSWKIQPDGCIRYFAKDTSGVDTAIVIFGGKERDRWVSYVAQISKLVAENASSVSFALEPHDPPFPHDIRNIGFQPADPFSAFLARWAQLIRVLALIAMAGLLYQFLRWRAQRRKKLIAQRDKSAKPPYVWNIRIKNLAPPDPGEAFGQTINALRRRADDASRLIDLPETVRATIRGAGMAEFRFKQQTRPPEYLMLVDRRNAHDHQARLYDDLYHILLQNEVLAERFFFDGDIKICINEQHPEGLSIDELLFRFPGHRLLIIGSGRQFFSTNTGGLAPWTKAFSKWKERALLSTLPAGEWGRRERALAELFRFAPASLSGLGSLIEAFEADTEQRAPQLDRLASLSTAAPVLLEGGDLLQTLEKHFPDPSTRTWLATCALWPELHYDLTLWLGQWLGQESGQPVATMQRFSDLLRLPWFANGEMPDYARAVLLDWLRQSPGLESRIRTALHLMLEENAPPEDSAAWDDFDMRIAFNEWQITTDPKTKKALEEKIALWLEQNEPDFIVVRELIGQPGPLDSLLPDSWKKAFFKGRRPGMGLREHWKDALRIVLPVLAVAAFALWYFWQPELPRCAGEQARVAVGSDTITVCASTEEDKLLLWEYRMQAAAGRGDSIAFDSLLQRFPMALDSAATSAFCQECLINVSNAAYNAGLDAYRVADSLQQTNPGSDEIARFKNAACTWVSLAAGEQLNDSLQVYTWTMGKLVFKSLPWVRESQTWCAGKNITTVPPGDPACRKVANLGTFIGFRNRELTRPELNIVFDKPDGKLARETLIQALAPGETVELLDSTLDFWKVRFEGKTGYVARSALQKPTLLPCGRKGISVTALPAANIPMPVTIFVKGGTFTMGSPETEAGRFDGEKQHQVTVSDFEIGQTEVTNEQYCAFLNEKGNQQEGGVAWINLEGSFSSEKCRIQSAGSNRFTVEKGYEKHPVIYVSWYGAGAYCNWLSQRANKKFRLPTEAEWEYAARGGSPSKSYLYAGSDNVDAVAWYTGNTNDTGTRPVATKKPNDLGLYDMSGNVREWCGDWYGDYEKDAGKPVLNPKGADKGDYRVRRGGSWYYGARYCRAATRSISSPEYRDSGLGFRLCLSSQ